VMLFGKTSLPSPGGFNKPFYSLLLSELMSEGQKRLW
jgi:hypothetical protein